MSFVSYAQNNEDVMLARVFRGLDSGFYIDVGAQDPRIDSVTKAFYDQGWRGINLEPVASWYQKLCQDRPRDINLCVAAGAQDGLVDFYEIADTGLSTSSAEFAQRHLAQGHASVTTRVQVRTLDAICAEHGVGLVHFLKVDAEGAEAEVLRGIDLSRLRPWVILVEATEPNSPVSTHADWEPLLVDRGYVFVYNDGLNRFYLASEHSELRAAFATPPNVYDDFVLREIIDHQNHEIGLGQHIAAVEDLSQLRLEQIERLDAIVAEKDKALAGALTTLVREQAEVTRLHEAVADREARLSRLHLQLTERESEFGALRVVLAGRESELSALQSVLAEHEASLSSLRTLVAGHEAELRVRKARIAKLAARLQGSEQAVAGLSRSLLDAQAARLAAEAGWSAALLEHQVTLGALARAQKDFQDIISSRSWRLTSPLRRIMTLATAARARCLRALGMLAPQGSPAPEPRREANGDVLAPPAPAEPSPPPALPISEDAERILARCPVLEPATTDEGAR